MKNIIIFIVIALAACAKEAPIYCHDCYLIERYSNDTITYGEFNFYKPLATPDNGLFDDYHYKKECNLLDTSYSKVVAYTTEKGDTTILYEWKCK
jgi:hypothetical protein